MMEDLVVPEGLKPYLRKPLGELFTGDDAIDRVKERVGEANIIAVGDVVAREAEKAGLKPKVKVIDFRVKRKEIERSEIEGKAIEASNPPSHITKELWDAIHECVAVREDCTVVVDGEEDLAVLPAVIEAEWGDYIIYGQPDEGVVLVTSDDDSKFQVGTIIKMIMDKEELRI